MDTQSYETSVEICNQLGLHARAATKFVQLAAKFPCEVFVAKDGQEVNGKSIMGVLMLVASMGTVIAIKTRGPQAREAGDALAALVANRFGEEK